MNPENPALVTSTCLVSYRSLLADYKYLPLILASTLTCRAEEKTKFGNWNIFVHPETPQGQFRNDGAFSSNF